MEALYHQTNHIIHDIQLCLQSLNQRTDVSNVENDIQTKITTVNANCDRMDVLLYKMVASDRTASKMRLDQLKYDIRHLQTAYELWQERRSRKEMEANEREQLLNRRFTANPETSIDMDASLQHQRSLLNANRGVDDMISTGSSVLESLRSQRITLKGARERLIGIGSTLGLSNHTMRLIETRVSEDKYVLFGGMAVTLLIIIGILYYFVF